MRIQPVSFIILGIYYSYKYTYIRVCVCLPVGCFTRKRIYSNIPLHAGLLHVGILTRLLSAQ